ncbi:MAG: B12-binding domain-containing radical SAM protein, partial [Coprococcus sp.]
VIYDVYKAGQIFDAWTEFFKKENWDNAMAKHGLDIDFYTYRDRSVDEILPWDFIDIGVTRKFLEREWENAQNEKVTPNCRQQCSGCGAARFGGGVCFENKN